MWEASWILGEDLPTRAQQEAACPGDGAKLNRPYGSTRGRARLLILAAARKPPAVRRTVMSEIAFDPQNVADWFAEIMKLPHESGKEDPLRAAVYTWLTDPAHGIGLSPENVFYDATARDPGKRVIYAFRP